MSARSVVLNLRDSLDWLESDLDEYREKLARARTGIDPLSANKIRALEAAIGFTSTEISEVRGQYRTARAANVGIPDNEISEEYRAA